MINDNNTAKEDYDYIQRLGFSPEIDFDMLVPF